MPVTPLEIAQLWRHVNRRMRALFRSAAREYDVPPFSFMLLRRIEEEPGITLSDLARCSGASKSHTSTIVDQLVQEGYVEKRSDPADQRVTRLHLTDAARRRFEGIEELAKDVWTIILQELPDAGIDDVERFLRSLLEAAERAHARLGQEERQGEVSEAAHDPETGLERP